MGHRVKNTGSVAGAIGAAVAILFVALVVVGFIFWFFGGDPPAR